MKIGKSSMKFIMVMSLAIVLHLIKVRLLTIIKVRKGRLNMRMEEYYMNMRIR